MIPHMKPRLISLSSQVSISDIIYVKEYAKIKQPIISWPALYGQYKVKNKLKIITPYNILCMHGALLHIACGARRSLKPIA